MVSFPNAKINIGLFVTGKRQDNYHTIESVFYPIKFEDVLEAGFYDPAFSLLQVSGITIEGDDQSNLVVKAVGLMKEFLANEPKKREQLDQLRFFLHKNIPTGAGLGGGSADGVFTLKLIDSLLSLNLSNEKLAEMALQLGSDCPFFIYNSASYVTGRGESITPVSLSLEGYHLALVLPGIHVSTKEAYAKITPVKPEFDLKKLADLKIENWKDHLRNDFEKPVFEMYPEIKKIKDSLYENGAVYAQMSGSGSAVFGIFKKEEFKKDLLDKSLRNFTRYYIAL